MMKKVLKLNRNTESGSSPAHLQVPPLFRFPRCHFPLSCHSDRSPGIQSFDCHFQELSLSFAISFLQAHSLSVSEWGEVQLGADLATALLTPTYLKQVRLQNILSHLPHQADTYVSTYIPPIHLHTNLPQAGALDTAYTLIPVVDSSTYSFRSSTPCCCFMLSFGTPKMKDLACSSWWILCPLWSKNLSVSDWKKEILGKGIWEGQNVVNGEVLATKKNLEEFNKGVKES